MAAKAGNKISSNASVGSVGSVRSLYTTGTTKSAKETREAVRDYIRNDRDTILVRWMCLEEGVRSEDRYRDKFLDRQMKIDLKKMPINILKFHGTLKRAVRKTIRTKGGTPFSIIRALFMYWGTGTGGGGDGTLTTEGLRNCMNSLGVKMSDAERLEVVLYYDSGKGSNPPTMAYDELLQDITRGEPTAIQTCDDSYLDGDDIEMRYEEIADQYAIKPPVIREFIEATRNYIMNAMRVEGGTPYYHVRYLFQFFDYDLSNGLSPEELHTAAKKKMKLNINLAQAQEIVKFYDRHNEGQMQYVDFLKDVQEGELSRPILAFKELTQEEVRQAKESLSKNIFMPRPFKATVNRVLEEFKLALKRSLSKKISVQGGRFESWIREAFCEFDMSLTNKVASLDSIKDIANKLGVSISSTEALTVRNSYDKHGTGEMHYLDFIKDMDLEDPHFLTVSGGGQEKAEHATSRTPAQVAQVVARIKRAVDIFAKKSANVVSSRDVLYGTCLRYDTSRGGRLTQEQVHAVAAELGVPIRPDEVSALIEWFDSSSSRLLDFRSLVRQIYSGDDALTRTLTLPKLNKKAGNSLYNVTVTYVTAGNFDNSDDNASVDSNSSYKVITKSGCSSTAMGDKSMQVVESKKDKATRLAAKRDIVLHERETIVAKLAALDAAKKKLQQDHAARRARELAVKTREDNALHLQNMALSHQLKREASNKK